MQVSQKHFKSKPKTYSKYEIHPDGSEVFIQDCKLLPEQAEHLNINQPSEAKPGSLAKYEYRLKK